MGSYLVRRILMNFTFTPCCLLSIKGDSKRSSNVLHVRETINISAFYMNSRNESEIHQMLQAENCTNNSQFWDLLEQGGQMSGNNQLPMESKTETYTII